MQYRTDNISKNIAIKFFKIITSTRKNKFYNKENYKGLIKQFYNPKENLYVCKDLYEASIE
jgi:TATA-box binding protein (TBP) (component of TFIID and TFIIIB)